jgi:hypothetical protein
VFPFERRHRARVRPEAVVVGGGVIGKRRDSKDRRQRVLAQHQVVSALARFSERYGDCGVAVGVALDEPFEAEVDERGRLDGELAGNRGGSRLSDTRDLRLLNGGDRREKR